ncbi:DUF2829 domain-containing protein [Wielerella bovis]|uniref:DUF2829 domain-containing protein n=1 Tax=Wielerella bovis TaxID=2917790 RepID=UPI00201949DE|nr:DUF2829 domain-containing protein [Wielerella bovis]ULJ66648.1 DUF2829 domain-containing protein [Wielerella bovis]
MKNYVGGLRAIQAKQMTREEYNDLRGWQVPQDENPSDDGYLIVNPNVSERNVDGFDGYVSWLPTKAFNEQYRVENLSFGQAVELLKLGKRVARKNWNAANQFVYFVPENKYPASRNPNSPIQGYFENDEVPYRAYLALKTAQDDVATWVPSISDVLAEDWLIV